MRHIISGNNFHGNYELALIGPKEGFELSKGQIRRYKRTLCPFVECGCGG